MISFINLKTFEITDEVENFIYCDDEIVKTIAILNKKGYKTIYSCAGHNKNGELLLTRKDSIEDYQEYLKECESDKTIHIIGSDDQYFYHKDDVTLTATYVVFDKKYDFPNLPKNFKLELLDNNRVSVEKVCEFFIDRKKGIRKSDCDINKELLENQKNLYEWALSLDNNKER